MQTIYAMPFLLTGILIVIIICIYAFLKKKSINKILFYGILSVYFLILISCIWFPMYISPGLRFEYIDDSAVWCDGAVFLQRKKALEVYS